MPTYNFTCEICGTPGRAWRQEGSPPRFCSKECKNIGLSGKSLKQIKWPITPEIHERIKTIYQRDTGNGQVAALAKSLGYPRWKLSRYAVGQGWVPKQKKEPDWTGEEVHILQLNGHLSPVTIQKKLTKYGFTRSVTGIVLKRKRMRLAQNLDGHSSRALAECLGVDSHFVTRAIKTGRLRAMKRGTSRTKQQGGDIWYIKDKNIRKYIIENVHEIDIRKVDKYWFVDILVNAA